MGALSDESPNTATTVFVLLNVTVADDVVENVVWAGETAPKKVSASVTPIRIRFIVSYASEKGP
jgi:hypothetical protein